MSKILEILLNDQYDTFCLFDQVFLFGSALRCDLPNDIDILLVYDIASPEQVNIEKRRVAQVLAKKLAYYTIDFTTLSKSELQETDFLRKVPHRKVKG